MAKKTIAKAKAKGASPRKTIGLSFLVDEANDIEARAKSMSLSTSTYCKIILREWIKSGKKLTLSE